MNLEQLNLLEKDVKQLLERIDILRRAKMVEYPIRIGYDITEKVNTRDTSSLRLKNEFDQEGRLKITVEDCD